MTLRVPDVADKAFDALAADTTLRTLLGGTSKVYSYIPEDVAPPYVLVLGGDFDPIAPADIRSLVRTHRRRDVAATIAPASSGIPGSTARLTSANAIGPSSWCWATVPNRPTVRPAPVGQNMRGVVDRMRDWFKGNF